MDLLATPGMFALVLGLSVVILLALVFLPHYKADRRFGKNEKDAPVGDERWRRYQENRERNNKQLELDALLEKTARDGLQSLSDSERERMEQLSKELYR